MNKRTILIIAWSMINFYGMAAQKPAPATTPTPKLLSVEDAKKAFSVLFYKIMPADNNWVFSPEKFPSLEAIMPTIAQSKDAALYKQLFAWMRRILQTAYDTVIKKALPNVSSFATDKAKYNAFSNALTKDTIPIETKNALALAASNLYKEIKSYPWSRLSQNDDYDKYLRGATKGLSDRIANNIEMVHTAILDAIDNSVNKSIQPQWDALFPPILNSKNCIIQSDVFPSMETFKQYTKYGGYSKNIETFLASLLHVVGWAHEIIEPLIKDGKIDASSLSSDQRKELEQQLEAIQKEFSDAVTKDNTAYSVGEDELFPKTAYDAILFVHHEALKQKVGLDLLNIISTVKGSTASKIKAHVSTQFSKFKNWVTGKKSAVTTPAAMPAPAAK